MNQLATFENNYEDIDPHMDNIFDFDKLYNTKEISLVEDVFIEDKPKKKPKKEKSTKTKESTANMVPADSDRELSMTESNQPYMTSYDETNAMLKSSIIQIDDMQNQLNMELNKIRNSNTLRKKYDYMSTMMDTSSHLINTKVTAIREINKTITDCHNLEMKRIKELKLNESKQDDDKYIMDMYNAFISTPTGNYSQIGPSSMDMNNSMMQGNGFIGNAQYSYNDYINNMDPAQRLMNYENDPNIRVCVVYDESTGTRFFQVINKATGEVVPGMETPDPLFLEDIVLDPRNGIARNKNLDITYDLITINGNNSIMEY